ncbi:MAG: ATP-binding cassette domain-containing protein [Bacilli bacterium]|nr:ATP-binding cassette domain-containing protein [Bacilli bacterium]
MLELKNIYKSYQLSDNRQEVLKDINISFRKNEFVSILGPSGSGKTTLLNIIGGIDNYDSGDLIIDNISTTKYTNSNWDNYRNKKIGFVFQNYNLIDHLSIFDNVRLALTLSGLSKNEVYNKSVDALKSVGLIEHINKKPNQLSGGQMQRVAIARAIVKNPDIIVADEPTGALDSKTSAEIMKILKDISKNRLVIMVTHNQELAKEYSSRIVSIEDGKIINDSNPYKVINKDKNEISSNKSLKFITSLELSFKNLLTKRKRAILTSFACSIGIIGIALVLSITNGVNKYIKDVEVNSINDYPIIIERNTYDVFETVSLPRKKCENNKVCINDEKNGLIIKNNIKDFKNYIDINDKFKKYATNIVSSYDIDLNVYNKDYKKIDKDLFKELNFSDYSIVYGRKPKEYNEIVIVLDKNNYLSKDFLSYLNLDINKTHFTYNEIINNSFKLILNTDYYKKEENHYVDYSNNLEFIKNIVNSGVDLKIVGILNSEESMNSCIGYTEKLNKYLIDNISKTEIYRDQINSKKTNVTNNTNFDDFDNTYESLEKFLGVYEINNPSKISIYAKDYKSKEKIISLINEYNEKQTDKDKIKYNDMMKLLVDTLLNILNVISYVLIGFASISLVVSSIMISIITYISVLERTKEIGVLRAIGASKKDIKKIFNAETIIEGFLAGVIGIIITKFLSVFINLIVRNIIDIKNISILSINNIFSLIILSILVNLLSGLKPSITASNKNIVDAFRCD